MSLNKFIAQRNVFNQLFNKPVLDPKNLTDAQCKELAHDLSVALSPESLTCDGELRGAKLQAKARMLYKAQEELEAKGYAVVY